LHIEHQPELTRFIAAVDDQEACLEYRLLPDEAIDFTYTYVPRRLRGRGIAAELVRSGLAWADQQGYQIRASCWYVRRFLHS
jgi:hypothetical protein